VRGVGSVARVGGVTREVRVELDPARLLALNATAADVSRQLRPCSRTPPAAAPTGRAEQSVRTIATVQSAAELGALEIPLSDGRRVRLDQVATVSDTVAEQRSGALLNGKPVVGFEITRSRGAGEVDVAAGVRAALAKLRPPTPTCASPRPSTSSTRWSRTTTARCAAVRGRLLAVLVVWLFLRDWRATFVAAVALPLSVIPAFMR
jgi:multidrug efflux pump subunit AcrB